MVNGSLLELNGVVAVATHKSFRRAAIELGISASALSHAIAALEQRMGIRLFHRTTRSVGLSEAGERFLARVRPALLEITGAVEEAVELRDTPGGSLRLTAGEAPGQAREAIAKSLQTFLQRYPDVHVELVTDGRLVDIVADGFDAGIRLAESVPQDMIAIPCSPPLRFAVVGSPSYLMERGRPLAPSDLRAHECIRNRMASGSVFRWEFEKRGAELAIEVKGRLTLDSHALMIEAAVHGAGLVWTSEWAVADHLAAGRLVRVLADWTPAYPGLRLFYPSHRHVSAALRAFVEVLREVTAEWSRGVCDRGASARAASEPGRSKRRSTSSTVKASGKPSTASHARGVAPVARERARKV